MIFSHHDERRVGSLPCLGTTAKQALYRYKCGAVPIRTRNLASVPYIQDSFDNFQVALESRLTRCRTHLAGYVLPIGHAIPNIPVFVDVGRTK